MKKKLRESASEVRWLHDVEATKLAKEKKARRTGPQSQNDFGI